MSFAPRLLLLLVDDDARLRELATAAAERTGRFSEIVAVEHGAAALDWLRRKGAPDVVLTDLSMPEMDGLELAKAIQADPQLREIPVVMFSSSNRPNDREQAMAAGCRIFFEKPASLIALQDVLGSVADLAHERDPSEASRPQ